MPFPDSERVVFQENPIAEVICQLRFPTILEIGTADPADFQKRIRASYPIYSKDNGGSAVPPGVTQLMDQLQISLPLGGGQTLTHKFATEDEKRSISLTTGFIAVSELDYVEWHSLRKEIESALDAFEATYQPAFYSRVGLRYRDMVDQTRLGLSVPWDELLSPFLIGMLGVEEIKKEISELSGSVLMALDEVKGGHIRLRHGLAEGSNGQQVYLVDTDFYTSEKVRRDDALDTLDIFRRHSGNLFRWAIKPRLYEALLPGK